MAQSLSLPVRTSAHLIPLPTAALQPVLQKNGPGRRPRNSNIINSHRWKFGRVIAVKAQHIATQTAVEESRQFMQTCERLYQEARGKYIAAQQQAAKPV